jgi:hypothetical protein
MATMLDIIGSMLIRGAILMMMLNLSLQMNKAVYQKTGFAAMRQNTAISTQILYDDLYLATSFTTATPDSIQFAADVNNDGVSEAVHYYLAGQSSPTIPLKMLYRSINGGTAQLVAHNVAKLKVEYYNLNGSSTAIVGDVKSVRFWVSIQTEEQSSQENEKPMLAFWEKIVFPPNRY